MRKEFDNYQIFNATPKCIQIKHYDLSNKNSISSSCFGDENFNKYLKKFRNLIKYKQGQILIYPFPNTDTHLFIFNDKDIYPKKIYLEVVSEYGFLKVIHCKKQLCTSIRVI